MKLASFQPCNDHAGPWPITEQVGWAWAGHKKRRLETCGRAVWGARDATDNLNTPPTRETPPASTPPPEPLVGAPHRTLHLETWLCPSVLS
ncbi:hypothetical protein NDU88_003879 [Pleurodeles waltl]|uniref:Uncharacterized protein n=1 Tax=Pleurodeles waltl TaxID=8319 RepID=A0AAV7T6D4_PLEWA|nr:hypothetical protein NDU88_003879 [Pleurodeles waltl]